MFDRKSRYRDARPFSPADGDRDAFDGVRPRPIGRATGIVEHRVQAGDRLDLLARHYYNDDRLWWRIVDANPEILYAGDVIVGDAPGRVILIPRMAG
jgi:nucleoid-associated protein YgaU